MSRFIYMMCDHRRKKFQKTNQDFNFLEDSVRTLIQFKKKNTIPASPKMIFHYYNDFHINSNRVTKNVD